MAKKQKELKVQLVDLLRENTSRWDTYTVWGDWVAMCALAISNACDHYHQEEREAEYARIVGKYSKEEIDRFHMAFAMLVQVVEQGRFGDFLGETYMLLEIGNKQGGQFFTPYHICQFMAKVNVGGTASGGLDEHIKEKGFVTVAEPACGSGAMVIAFAEAMYEAGYNPQQQMWAQLRDISITAVHMTYVQLSLLGIPAMVIHGNTLTMETMSTWLTPFHILGGWGWKLKGKRSPAEVIGGLTELLTADTNPFEESAPVGQPEQMALFEVAA